MTDRYLEFTRSPLGRRFANALGLPTPPALRRAEGPSAERPFKECPVLLGGCASARYWPSVLPALQAAGAELRVAQPQSGVETLRKVAQTAALTLRDEPAPGESAPPAHYLFNACGLDRTEQLQDLYDFFHGRLARLPSRSHCLVLVDAPEQSDWAEAAVHASLRGFVRSLAKEIGRRGSTVNLVEVAPGGEDWLAGPLRFLLSDHAAFVTGQCLGVSRAARGAESVTRFASPLSGKVAVVTGAARGIGAAIARTLAREGAQVVGIDRLQEETALGTVLADIGGQGLTLDITAADAGDRIAAEVGKAHGALDILVHNAGVTRDKTLKNMPAAYWKQVLDVNLGAVLRMTGRLLKEEGTIRAGGRIVCISSISGIAGNPGQTNYAATKAGLMGLAEAAAPMLAERGITINAVAPGFIETQMTAAMPALPRELGRRLSSLGQAGLPQDIAEAVLFLASPAAAGVTGRTLRVCGQNLVGA